MIFDQREDLEEKRFAHDEELRFKARAQANRVLGMWAGTKIGKNPEETEVYAQSFIASDILMGGEIALFQKIRQDFDAAQVECSDHQIQRKMAEALESVTTHLKSSHV